LKVSSVNPTWYVYVHRKQVSYSIVTKWHHTRDVVRVVMLCRYISHEAFVATKFNQMFNQPPATP